MSNVLEFRSRIGDAPLFFAPKDSATVVVTLTSPAGRPQRILEIGQTDPEHDPNERWSAQLPEFQVEGRWILLFDQDGVDTTYLIDVYQDGVV
jgi:hypothetical protein